MKVLVHYETTARVYKSSTTYSNVVCLVEVDVIELFRYSLCRSTKHQRFVYMAKFKAPEDAEFKSSDGYLLKSINRKLNKDFKPKKFSFKNNHCYIDAQ